MAFTKQPDLETYHTKPIRLFNQLDKLDNDPDKDTDFLNAYIDILQNKQTDDKDLHLVKRAGTISYGAALPSAAVRGGFHWEEIDRFFIAVDNDIVVLVSSTGALNTTLSNVFSTSSGVVGFTEFYFASSNERKVVATDGTTLLTIDASNTVVTSSDPDLPTPHLPNPVYLDGYLFLSKVNTQDLYNSDLDDPLAWTPGNFISTEMFPDNNNQLVKMNNYLLVFGTFAIEYFWDAANSTGSPLQRNDTPVKLTGYLGGLVQYGNQILFVGQNQTGTPTVYMLQDFTLKEIATPTVQKYLASLLPGVYTTMLAAIVSFDGHDFYCLTVGDLTYVYDLKTEQWARWAYRQDSLFPVKFAFNVGVTATANNTVLYMSSNSTLHRMGSDLFQDAGVNFTMQAVTDKEYFDSYHQKFMSKLTVRSDRPTTSASLDISWTDDDYQTYSTPVSLELDQELPCIRRLGRFRRRAFKLEFTNNFPLRIEGLEADVNLGNW